MEDVVIISGVRHTDAKFQGRWRTSPRRSWCDSVREAVKRAKIAPEQVDECIMAW